MDDKIVIFDTTLRDGEQSPGASMNEAEKVQLAMHMERMGVDILEAGFPAASEGDFNAVSEISKKIKEMRITALSRTDKKDIDLAWNAVKHAPNNCIHVLEGQDTGMAPLTPYLIPLRRLQVQKPNCCDLRSMR